MPQNKTKRKSIIIGITRKPKVRSLLSRQGKTKILVAILIVVAASAVAGISYYSATHPPSPNGSPTVTASPAPTVSPTSTKTLTPTISVNPPTTSTSTPSLQTTQEKVRDSVMSFIGSNHPETEQFMTDLVWTGGRATPQNLVGAETYMYYSQGWNFTINYPVVPNAIYKITADYSANSTGIPNRIIWQGTWQNEVINETSYVFAQ